MARELASTLEFDRPTIDIRPELRRLVLLKSSDDDRMAVQDTEAKFSTVSMVNCFINISIIAYYSNKKII
jgi:hypothetical protein